MPLSKESDKERKRKERAQARVQPKDHFDRCAYVNPARGGAGIVWERWGDT